MDFVWAGLDLILAGFLFYWAQNFRDIRSDHPVAIMILCSLLYSWAFSGVVVASLAVS